MVEETSYGIDDILTVEELESLGSPDSLWEMPDAQVFEWGDNIAVATPGFSIASSMDRFAGPMNRPQVQALEGFYSEFTEDGKRVVIAGEELRDLVGDKAVARIQGFDESYAVNVRTPDEVTDAISRYHEQYAGDVEGDFWSKVDANNALLPVVYSQEGVVPEMGVALMQGEGMMVSSDVSNEDIFEEVENSTIQNDIHLDRHKAPDSAEAEYFVDIMLPPEYDEVTHEVVEQGIIIDIDGERLLESFPESVSIQDYSERNGLYTIELN